jgi:FtsZ-interacting cell division protein ZipA
MKNQILIMIAIVALISLIVLGVAAAKVSTPNINMKANSVEKDKKVLSQYYDEKLVIYKTTKECNKVKLVPASRWKNRVIVSKKTYSDARYPFKKYCGIIYYHK